MKGLPALCNGPHSRGQAWQVHLCEPTLMSSQIDQTAGLPCRSNAVYIYVHTL